jgi:hypothetical protein
MRTIRLSRRTLKRVAKILLIVLSVGIASFGLFSLGQMVTPTPSTGYRPVIYTLSVRRTEQYRRQTQAYLDDLAELDSALAHILSNPNHNVYDLSEAAEANLRTAGRLDQAVNLDYPPSALVSLKRGLQTAATGYLEAALAINAWVGEPTEEHYRQALEALRLARMAYGNVQANPWLDRSPATDVSAEPLSTDQPNDEDSPSGGWSE